MGPPERRKNLGIAGAGQQRKNFLVHEIAKLREVMSADAVRAKRPKLPVRTAIARPEIKHQFAGGLRLGRGQDEERERARRDDFRRRRVIHSLQEIEPIDPIRSGHAMDRSSSGTRGQRCGECAILPVLLATSGRGPGAYGLLLLRSRRPRFGVDDPEWAAFRNLPGGIGLIDLQDRGPEVLAEHSSSVGRAITDSRKFPSVGDLGEIKRNFIGPTGSGD